MSCLRPLLVTALAVLGACQTDLGNCDPAAAGQLYYTQSEGLPAFAGQALMDDGCVANGHCHASDATGPERYGTPEGYDLDVRPALTPEELDRLASSLSRVRAQAAHIQAQVEDGLMPPPDPARSEALAAAPRYATNSGDPLPAIGTRAANEMLRNWLACGAPVVEGTSGDPTGIGYIVPVLPRDCPAGQAECSPRICQDVLQDPANCGACGNDCGDLFCADGRCTATCPAGTVGCNRTCVDTQSDPQHCGGCTQICDPGELCEGGLCVCGTGTADCGDGTCIDTTADPSNCGGCGVACAVGELCSGGACVSCGPDVSYAAGIQPIFNRYCSNCHSSSRPAGGLTLTSSRSYDELVGVHSSSWRCGDRVLVVPGDPDASYLMDKLMGAPSICGVQMPRRGVFIPANDMEKTRSWICRGAPNN